MKGISIIGLGKLGLPLAVVFANKNYFTIGIDIDDTTNTVNVDGLITLSYAYTLSKVSIKVAFSNEVGASNMEELSDYYILE